MPASFPPSPESNTSASRRRGRDRALSYPTPATMPEASPVRLESPRRTARWQLWLILVLLASAAIAFLTPTLIGIYFGMQERQALMHERAIEHYKQALAYESEEYNELAVAELQIAVKFDPAYQPALDKLRVLQTTPTANGTTVPDSAAIADQLFSRAQAAIDGRQWSDAIDSLEEIRRADENYRAGQVKSLLIQAYLNGGKQAVTAGQIEQARSRFEAVLALDPTNAEALSLRDRAALYVVGTQAKDTDWAGAVVNFQKLYQLDASFYDIKKQLLNALIQYGDLATRQGAVCIAAREYEQASRLDLGTDVANKLSEANASCKLTVTAPTATPTVSGSETPGAAPSPIPGSFSFVASGHVDAGGACQGEGSIAGIVRDAQGVPLPGVAVRIYNDLDYHPAPFITDAAGKYGDIVLGINQGLFHLVVVGPQGSPVSAAFNLNYPGGLASGCHWIIDWMRTQ